MLSKEISEIAKSVLFATAVTFSFSLSIASDVNVEQIEAPAQSTPPNFARVTTKTAWLIGRFEGWIPKIYECPAGYPTIGFGHLISYNKDFDPVQELALFKSQVQASELSLLQKDEIMTSLERCRELTEAGGLALLQSDIRRCADITTIIKPEIFAALSPNRVDSLASLTFNLGVNAIGGSFVVRLIHGGKTDHEAADWISPWRKANGAFMLGLAKRRLVEVMIFLGRSLDSNSDDVPSIQWGVSPMQYTDENWTKLRDADKANGSRLLMDAVKIYEEYMVLGVAA